MDRRLILLGLATGVAASTGPVLAQSTAASPPSSTMGQAEIEHATKTGAAGAASLQIADIGMQKATNPAVKNFAKLEHDEQTTIAEVLKSMAPSAGTPKPDPKMADVVEALRKMTAGPEFDRMFVKAQIDGHEVLLGLQEAYLKVGKDREVSNVSKLARGHIKEHLSDLAVLQRAMS